MLTILASVSYKISLYRKTVTLAVTTHPKNKILHQSFHPANNTDHISLIRSLSACDVVRSVKNHNDFLQSFAFPCLTFHLITERGVNK